MSGVFERNSGWYRGNVFIVPEVSNHFWGVFFIVRAPSSNTIFAKSA